MNISLHVLFGSAIQEDVNKIKEQIDDYKGPVILDFEGIEFISKEFANELCELEENCRVNGIAIEEQNKCELVRNIIHLVKEGRRMHIHPVSSQPSTRSFKTLEELGEWLND